ncbi:MAG TPA: VOC family protein [Opitutaceae bacterium]|jgi:predicted enzyme related to lactoylglutathione lyase
MPIKISNVAYVCYPVADIGRARSFYEGLLGLKAQVNWETQPGKWWVEYDAQGVTVAVTNAFGAAAAGGASLALEVEDLDAALAAVKGAGIALTIEPQDFPPCRMFGINSPDGHPIILHKRKA